MVLFISPGVEIVALSLQELTVSLRVSKALKTKNMLKSTITFLHSCASMEALLSVCVSSNDQSEQQPPLQLHVAENWHNHFYFFYINATQL